MLSLLSILSPVSAYSNSSIPAGNVSISTEVVTAYTTFCPSATSFVEGSSTYIVTEPTTLTITDCPCTRTHTYSTATVTVCPTSAVPPSVASSNSSAAPVMANGAGIKGVSIGAAVGAMAAVAALL